jgi:excisionase family DNA binding protein
MRAPSPVIAANNEALLATAIEAAVSAAKSVALASIPRDAYSPEQAAIRAGISRATIFRLIKSKAIRSQKVGTRTLIRSADLQAFLDGLPVNE